MKLKIQSCFYGGYSGLNYTLDIWQSAKKDRGFK
jgi:hypothetical protein